LAIIDGQAGTGKSYTLAAIREAYEASGARVIGLAPTNAVAQDMKGDGFGHAATLHSELFALNNGRRVWDSKTVVIVDEAAMLDTKLMAMLTAHAHDAGAKLILVGDDRQLSSIDHGGMFGVLKDRFGAAALTEVKRQHKLDERRAAEMMAEGNFHDALNIYEDKGAIHWTRTQGQARAELVEQWAKDSAAKPDKTRFVFAYTNDDVATLNATLRDVRRQRGELGEDHEIDTAHGRRAFAAGDRIQFTGTDKKAGIVNGAAGTIEAIDGTHLAVRLDIRQPKTINFDAANFDQFRHGYAGTIYRGQGRTLDQTYLYHSEHWRSAASYVALTRHRDKAELFVARNTAADVKQLARQMARTDERRAASMFHHRQDIGPVRPLTAAEILARFAPRGFEREQQQQPQQDERQAKRRAGDMGYSHGDYASQSRAALRDHQHRRQRRPQQDNQRMDQQDDLDEQRKRRAAWTPDEAMEMPEARKTQEPPAERPERPQEPANQNDPPTAEEKEASRLQEPFAEREGRPFQPSAPEPGRYDAMNGEAAKPEPVTLEAIQQNPWNAVQLEIPTEADRELLSLIATTAGHLRETLSAQGHLADNAEQAAALFSDSDKADARYNEAWDRLEKREAAAEPEPAPETMTLEAIRQDPWTAVYRPIPPDADASLLQQAHDAAMQCAGAVAGEPGPAQHAFAPDLLGADQTREQNFERAVRRLDELDGRMREATQERAQDQATEQPEAREPLTLDEWVQRIIDDPAREADELDREAEQPAQPATPEQESREPKEPEARGPLTLDDLAEWVQRIIDDPTREADELDPRILEALQAHREADQAAQPAAPEEDEREAAPSQEAEPESSAAKDAAEIDAEMTDEEQAAYDRWTGEKLGPATGAAHETGRSQGDGGGGGLSR
jgi:hypothetical protein